MLFERKKTYNKNFYENPFFTDFSDEELTQEEAIKNGHALNDEGYPLVADIAYAKNVLGVEPDATKEEVESRFVELSLKYHPDIGDEEIRDAEYFKTITEAYKTFMNQEILNPGQGKINPKE